MKNGKKDIPACFGDLDTVFPQGADGLRHSPKACLACAYKTECLRSAMQGEKGLGVREEKVDRAYSSGMLSFFERWSQKKEINARRKQKDKEKE
mgnify:CR=1 FL=1